MGVVSRVSRATVVSSDSSISVVLQIISVAVKKSGIVVSAGSCVVSIRGISVVISGEHRCPLRISQSSSGAEWSGSGSGMFCETQLQGEEDSAEHSHDDESLSELLELASVL